MQTNIYIYIQYIYIYIQYIYIYLKKLKYYIIQVFWSYQSEGFYIQTVEIEKLKFDVLHGDTRQAKFCEVVQSQQ